MTATLTQEQALLAYLNRYGSITPMEALRELHIYRLAARVKDLRDAGHTITTQRSGSATLYLLVRPEPAEQASLGLTA